MESEEKKGGENEVTKLQAEIVLIGLRKVAFFRIVC